MRKPSFYAGQVFMAKYSRDINIVCYNVYLYRQEACAPIALYKDIKVTIYACDKVSVFRTLGAMMKYASKLVIIMFK